MPYQVLLFFAFFIAIAPLQSQDRPTAKQIIEQIIQETDCDQLVDYLATDLSAGTNDLIKEGSRDTRVTGIITSMFAPMSVLEKAVEMNYNLIITHEPLYFNHYDDTEPFQGDRVYERKRQFIEDNNLVIWRFHDYIHCLEPDGIIAGMIEKIGWQDRAIDEDYRQIAFKNTSLKKILKHLKKVFPGNAFYVIGDPKMKINLIEYAPGAMGAGYHFNILRKSEVDLLIAGEVPQWETYEYIRDARSMGMHKAAIFLGHVNSEEAGMEYAARWMKRFIRDIPIYFVESGSPYWSY